MNIGALLAGLLSGVIGAMGMGGGAVLIVYLTLFLDVEQLKAQGTNLIFFIPIGVTALIIYSIKKEIKWKKALPLAVGGIVGTVCGFFLTNLLPTEIIGKIFGVFLILLGLNEIFKRKNLKIRKTTCNRQK